VCAVASRSGTQTSSRHIPSGLRLPARRPGEVVVGDEDARTVEIGVDRRRPTLVDEGEPVLTMSNPLVRCGTGSGRHGSRSGPAGR